MGKFVVTIGVRVLNSSGLAACCLVLYPSVVSSPSVDVACFLRYLCIICHFKFVTRPIEIEKEVTLVRLLTVLIKLVLHLPITFID